MGDYSAGGRGLASTVDDYGVMTNRARAVITGSHFGLEVVAKPVIVRPEVHGPTDSVRVEDKAAKIVMPVLARIVRARLDPKVSRIRVAPAASKHHDTGRAKPLRRGHVGRVAPVCVEPQ